MMLFVSHSLNNIKKHHGLIKWICLSIFAFHFMQANAQSQTLKEKARDYLIQKLEKSIKTNPQSRKALSLRLAHTLSLKAEDLLLKSETCKPCARQARETARQSLSIYNKEISSLKTKRPILYANSIFKMAYLSQMISENDQAIRYLKQILNMKISQDLKQRAHFNIGEILFENYKYSEALKYFNTILKNKDSIWYFQAYYRQIWSLYNLSKYQSAMDQLISFLQSPEYKNKKLTEKDFKTKQKLEGELIALFTNKYTTIREINFLYQFNKLDKSENSEQKRSERLYTLSKSLHRIGQAKASNQAYKIYLSKVKKSSSEQQLESYIAIIDNYFILNSKQWLMNEGYPVIKKILALKKKCSHKEVCEKTKRQVKRYMDELYRQKTASTDFKTKMLEVFQLYSQAYPDDLNTVVRAALTAQELKQYKRAASLFQEAVYLQEKEIKTVKNKKDKQNKKEDLERLLVSQLETAQLSEDEKTKKQAYEFYIEKGVNPNILYSSKYQLAYGEHKNKNYKNSSKLFKDLAIANVKKLDAKTQKLSKQAAHLSLSALNEMKTDPLMMVEYSSLFAKKFPEEKDFLNIYNTALFNKIKKLASKTDFASYPIIPSSDKSTLQAWNLLKQVKFSNLKPEEKDNYYLNQLLLSKELLNFKEMRAAIAKLLKSKSLSTEDRKVAMNWKLWLAETHFNFSEMLNLMKVVYPEASEARDLKLTRLTELAGGDYIASYEKLIADYPKSKLRRDTILYILEKTPKNQKKQMLKKYVADFAKDLDLLDYWILKLDNEQLNTTFFKDFTQQPFMEKSTVNQFVKKVDYLNDFENSYKKVSQFNLAKTTSPTRLARSIKAYTALIESLEKQAEVSVKMEDWLSQVLTFSKVYDEWIRFQTAILNLPMPKNLSPEEQIEYKTLLQSQILPYKKRSDELQNEIQKLLSQKYLVNYEKTLKDQPIYSGLIRWELRQLASVIMDPKQKENIEKLLLSISQNNKKNKLEPPSKNREKITSLQAKLRANPFNKDDLKKLIRLEEAYGNKVMAEYLKGRLEKLSKAKKNRVKL